jgi:uncharacterized protein YqeY
MVLVRQPEPETRTSGSARQLFRRGQFDRINRHLAWFPQSSAGRHEAKDEDGRMREQFTEALKDAMRAGDKRRVATVRLISAALKDRDIEARGAGKGPLSDDEILGLLQKMIKQRQESLKIYQDAGRTDLADQEAEEIAIISGFMPKQLDAAEVDAAIAAAIAETGAASMKDMGKVIAALRERYAGRMDFGKASAAVKAKLSGA